MGRLPHFTRSCCTHGSSVAAILLILALATSWVGAGFAQTPAVQLPRPAKPRIAIVNEKAFHLEVLAGFMHILSEYEDSVTVFMHPLNFDNRALDFGFVEYLHGFKGHLRALPAIGVPQFDMVIFVSPEYRLNYVREFIQRSKPKVVMCMVHNGDAVDVPELLKVHPNVHLMTLSPHVQRFVAARLNTAVDWMLPLKALPVSKPCKHTELPNCLSGFAIQVRGGFVGVGLDAWGMGQMRDLQRNGVAERCLWHTQSLRIPRGGFACGSTAPGIYLEHAATHRRTREVGAFACYNLQHSPPGVLLTAAASICCCSPRCC